MEALRKEMRAVVREELAKLLPELQQDPDQLLTTGEVAQMTTLTPGYFEIGRSKGNAGLPPYYKIGSRVMYRRGEVRDWLLTRQRGGQS